MIYTIGYTESYEQLFSEESIPRKLGKRDDINGKPYIGGIAFLVYDDAVAYAPEGYSVYGMECDETNTYEVNGERHIIDDAVLVKIS